MSGAMWRWMVDKILELDDNFAYQLTPCDTRHDESQNRVGNKIHMASRSRATLLNIRSILKETSHHTSIIPIAGTPHRYTRNNTA